MSIEQLVGTKNLKSNILLELKKDILIELIKNSFPNHKIDPGTFHHNLTIQIKSMIN